MFKFRKKSHQEVLDNIPNHIGIIMDGNGRWAKKRLQPRVMGHKAGMDALQKVTIEASQLGVKVLTVYAFSTENWSRPQDEVKFIMNLPVEFFNKYVPELDKNNVRILTIGDNSRLPKETLDALEKAVEQTKHNSGLVLNFAMNYTEGSQPVPAREPFPVRSFLTQPAYEIFFSSHFKPIYSRSRTVVQGPLCPGHHLVPGGGCGLRPPVLVHLCTRSYCPAYPLYFAGLLHGQ